MEARLAAVPVQAAQVLLRWLLMGDGKLLGHALEATDLFEATKLLYGLEKTPRRKQTNMYFSEVVHCRCLFVKFNPHDFQIMWIFVV